MADVKKLRLVGGGIFRCSRIPLAGAMLFEVIGIVNI